MKNYNLKLLISFLIISLSNLVTGQSSVSLFNGKDLSGWHKVGGTGQFTVEDGVIRGHGIDIKDNTFLTTNKIYDNFILELEARFDMDELTNSGIQFRSHAIGNRLRGYQFELDNGATTSNTGAVWDEYGNRGFIAPFIPLSWIHKADYKELMQKHGEAVKTFQTNTASLLKKRDWNTIKIHCQDGRVQTWLNGVKQADFTDPKGVGYKSGVIGLQLHSGKRCEVSWRNIHITPLQTTDNAASSTISDDKKEKHTVIQNLRALSRQWRIDLVWNGPNDNSCIYEVRKSETPNGPFKLLPKKNIYPIYTDFIAAGGKTYYYQVRAISSSTKQEIIPWSQVVKGTSAARDDNRLLDELQEAHIRFMTIASHPQSGMARAWLKADVHTGDNGAATGTGLGLANYIVGVERGFIKRQEAVEQVLKLLRFLDLKAEKHHGAFAHWTNMKNGKVFPFGKFDDGPDIAETSLLIQGIILVREYFSADNPEEKEIRQRADKLWKGVNWNWFRKDNGHALYWHWSPNHGWKMNLPVIGFCELEILYILGVASPTHPIPVESYFKGWRSPWFGQQRQAMGIDLELGQGLGGCSFWTYYSYVGLDPRKIKYKSKSMFEHFQDLTKVQIKYMRSKANIFKGYDTLWGLTASPNPDGYAGHKPGPEDNGTISPLAAPSVMPYTPHESIECIKKMYYDHGEKLWTEFGFIEAFNLTRNWYYPAQLTPDTAPVAPMIENYRSGLLWKLFMNAPEIKQAMQKIKDYDPKSVLP